MPRQALTLHQWQPGNLFVKGATAWRQIGVRTYPTAAGLLADTSAPEGSLGVAEDEETFWVMHSGAWHCHSRRPVADVAALAAWQNPPEGSTAMEQAEELRYHFHTGQWRSRNHSGLRQKQRSWHLLTDWMDKWLLLRYRHILCVPFWRVDVEPNSALRD